RKASPSRFRRMDFYDEIAGEAITAALENVQPIHNLAGWLIGTARNLVKQRLREDEERKAGLALLLSENRYDLGGADHDPWSPLTPEALAALPRLHGELAALPLRDQQ